MSDKLERVTALGAAWEQFKQVNDARLREIERKHQYGMNDRVDLANLQDGDVCVLRNGERRQWKNGDSWLYTERLSDLDIIRIERKHTSGSCARSCIETAAAGVDACAGE